MSERFVASSPAGAMKPPEAQVNHCPSRTRIALIDRGPHALQAASAKSTPSSRPLAYVPRRWRIADCFVAARNSEISGTVDAVPYKGNVAIVSASPRFSITHDLAASPWATATTKKKKKNMTPPDSSAASASQPRSRRAVWRNPKLRNTRVEVAQ